MKNVKTQTPLVIGIVVLVALAAGYFYISGTGGTSQPLTASSVMSPADVRLQQLSSQLSSLTFDTSVLTDPRFTALQDIAVPLQPEVVGRPDPFAHI